MDTERIKAHLNLFAVLQNLEDVVKLDPEMAQLTRNWNLCIQFSVFRGPKAYVLFENGVCYHGAGMHAIRTVTLRFKSPGHLNRVFDNKGIPIPTRGITRLGFLNSEYSKLTDRLAYYLKPSPENLANEDFLRTNTTLTLYTALYAARELAVLEPVSKGIAAHTPSGALQIEILPDGPCATITFDHGSVSVKKGAAVNPMAKMSFKNVHVAHALFNNQLDAFLAVGQGDVILRGQLPIIDNVNLILDRVAAYLS